MANRDITEGRSNNAIAFDVGIVSNTSVWQNTSVSYDMAIGGMPFIYAINDSRPYIRQTAPFRKEQFDNGREPGEQSLTGWWIRSQSSFHNGQGINFYDPSAGETVEYRFKDCKGVNVWTKGQVTLLRNTSASHVTTGPIQTSGRPFQRTFSIKWGTNNGILLWDEYDVDKIDADGNETHFVDYAAGGQYPVYAICEDGSNAYWATQILDSGVPKTAVYKKPLTGSTGTGVTYPSVTGDVTEMFKTSAIVINRGTMEYVKERIVMAINNSIYEMSTAAAALPTAVYTHPDSDIVYTSIAESGSAIYVAGYSGIQSTIIKFTLNTAGVMPTLTTAITAAEMPAGEKIYKIYQYLGYMLIGTSKGVRVATISEVDGSLGYGPLIVETSQPVYDFAARDRFVWCATGVDGEPGVIRLDLGAEIEPLRFAWANDLYYGGPTGYPTTSCSFIGETDRLAFTTAALYAADISNKQLTSNVATLTTSAAHGLEVGDEVWVEAVDATFNGYHVVTAVTSTTFSFAKTAGDVASTAVSPVGKVNKVGFIRIESESELQPTGYITTGNIRYNTLEPKNFKRLLGRGNFDYGSMTLETVDRDGTEYDHIAYDATVGPLEVTTLKPDTAQEYVAYKFILFRDGDDNTLGPVFQGYQAKATIATPRQRVMRFPVYCFDVETDRFNVQVGYAGRAYEKILALEDIEETGDVVTWQDLATGETRQVVIEQISFTRLTPPDKRFDGFGGVIEITIRTV